MTLYSARGTTFNLRAIQCQDGSVCYAAARLATTRTRRTTMASETEQTVRLYEELYLVTALLMKYKVLQHNSSAYLTLLFKGRGWPGSANP